MAQLREEMEERDSDLLELLLSNGVAQARDQRARENTNVQGLSAGVHGQVAAQTVVVVKHLLVRAKVEVSFELVQVRECKCHVWLHNATHLYRIASCDLHVLCTTGAIVHDIDFFV